MRIGELLAGNSYPGRGIALGLSADGRCAAAAYFIMGRSDNSRNRVFEMHSNGLFTEPCDEKRVVDPSLVIYRAVCRYEDKFIVTNGDQTDTIYSYLKDGKSFSRALDTRTFEPDAPNFTPRISGIADIGTQYSYTLSILKRTKDGAAQRLYFGYENPKAASMHLIHTYDGDGSPLPSFSGEPREFVIDKGLEDFADEVWDALDAENRISLFAAFIELSTGEMKSVIINKYQRS